MTVENSRLPEHVAFIMDGNGRWAQQRGLPRIEGHREGSKSMKKAIEYASKLGIKHLTFYAFSTENWKRPREEVDALMSMMYRYLCDVEKDTPDNVRLVILGETDVLSSEIKSKIETIKKKTCNNTGIIVNIAFNYGGRSEIVQAAQQLAKQCTLGSLDPAEITEQRFEECLYTAGQPAPDIIVRPSGELRLSNFLLWQAAYAELVFMDVLWPDFDKKCFDTVLAQYADRDRRFGGR